MALKLDILANTTQAQREVKDLSKALDDTSDSLDDLAKDSTQASDKMERNFRDMVKEAGKADKAVEKVGGSDGGFSKAGKASGEFKDEALSNFSEVTSSFDGSMSSIQDLAQGTLGGLATSGLPGVGLAAGAAAIAVGAIGAAIAANDAQSALSQQAIADWADAYVESSGRVLSAGVLSAKVQEILTDPEQFKAAEAAAKTWGVTTETAVSAIAGTPGAIADVTTSVNGLRDAYEKTASTEDAIDTFGNVNGTLVAQEQAAKSAEASLAKLTGEMSAGADRAKILSDYNIDLINSTAGATKEVDALGNAVYTLPDGTQIMIDAETQQATQNISNFKGDLDGIPETVTSNVRVTVDSSAYDSLKRQIERGLTVGINNTGRAFLE